jgi:hypothetical protein
MYENTTKTRNMKKSYEFKWIIDYYRVTKYFGSNIVEVEEQYKTWLGNYKWRRIYMGHIEPLKEITEFFNSCK